MEQDLIARVIEYADAKQLPETPTDLGIGGLALLRSRTPTPLTNTLYRPLLCVGLQGRKQTQFGNRIVDYGAGESLIVCVDLPTLSHVVDASPERPYVGFAIGIDLAILRELQIELEFDVDAREKDGAVASGAAGHHVRDAMCRLFDLIDRPPVERRVLAPLLVKEIHFRMLMEEHGGILRRLSRPDSRISRISRAIGKLRRDYAQPISVHELAELASMSLSSFHEHFKAITATTPIQFQKDIRLFAARQKLMAGAVSVASVAFEVGYESPTQFSREYSRKFGHPPVSNAT
ncbi:hypothetical protein CAI21_04845 [Alkalilimnicola ehrlichii]|uniref:AraC family transcriptional regulator n=1 Tax=Alkalilimnicola ehrlichii TaxID=351052 RepID=UPI000E2F6BBC|nr:AraC family transcriptional regulator [Alkalilimnicola ehrlichii]RFA30829.1 hypothetical protein CAI21_04845 [Alkalilimnicola ehrlichii]